MLDLGNNSLSGSQQGVNALCRLLEDRKCLIELDLYMNDIGNDGIERVRMASLGVEQCV